MLDFLKKNKVKAAPLIGSVGNLFSRYITGSQPSFVGYYTDWVFRCVNTIAVECGATKLRVYKKRANGELEEVTNGKLYDIINNPNSYTSGNDLIEGISAFLELDGNAYVLNEKTELTLLRSDWMSVVPSETDGELIKKYVYKVGQKEYPFEPDQIIHFRNFNPTFYNTQTPYKGMGTVEAAMNVIQEDQIIKEWNKNSLQKGAVPEGILEYDGNLSKEESARIQSEWKQKYGGSDNAGETPMLQGGLSYKRTGLTQSEMDFIQQRKMDRDDIFAMFGVPKGLLLSDDVNLANSQTALWSFTRFTVNPKLKKIESQINNTIVKAFGDNLVVQFDNPIPEDVDRKLKQHVAGHNRWLTTNEIRREEGYDDIAGGDELEDPLSIRLNAHKPTKKTKTITKEEKLNERDEKGMEVWNKFIDVQGGYEDKYNKAFKKYFTGLQARTLRTYSEDKAKKASPSNIIDEKKEIEIIFDILTPLQRELSEQQGKEAMDELGIGKDFEITEADKLDQEKYDLNLSGTLTETTTNDIKRILIVYEDESVFEKTERLKNYFDDAEQYRAERIARSETIRTANAATEQAWKQSNVVEGKEWFTAMDERVCPFCNEMDGKVADIGSNYFKKGDVLQVGDQDMRLDYSSISTPPLHAMCRCTLLAVIK